MLEIRDLRVSYGGVEAVQGISLDVPDGHIVTLIGGNGAGKSSTLRAISGITRVAGGTIAFHGREITNQPPHEIVGHGIAQSPEGRMAFSNLTVLENLRMGAYLRSDRRAVEADLEQCFTLFPRLKERLAQSAGTLSGGEQQMLAIARALMSKPKCLLLDEPSLGIAPILVQAIFARIAEINRSMGLAILLVEQNANLALQVAHYGYVMETGRIILHDSAEKLRKNDTVRAAYLGEC
ncbi:MAG: ABC transporter ATP-binding protein [Terrimicrobiaceae bacterium]|jgi:branched-chain amino acid transport system ATP-binding protein